MLKELYLLWLRLAAPQDLHYINGADTLPPPLPPEQERAALDALTRGQPQARDLLITHNLRLVVYIAKKFETPTAGIEDMISIGTIGLIKAVNTFEPTKNIKLATYASRCIENEILMYLRKSSNRRQDASIDEPLNTDTDGNELLLMDVLTTRRSARNWSAAPSAPPCAVRWGGCRPGSAASWSCASASTTRRSTPRRRSPTRWASPRAIFPGSKSASSAVCAGSWRQWDKKSAAP